jgi:hypothetical protein
MISPATTALADQIRAACAELTGNMRATAAATGWPLGDYSSDPWARALAATLARNAASGQLRSCPHLASPRPAITAAWRLDRLACPACAPPLFDLTGTPADRVCDRCGTDTAGHIHPSVLQVGPAIVMHGLCGLCHQTTRATRRPTQ